MTIHSQFLYFYIDELIRHHWVDWLEGPLSEAPAEEYRNIGGFQGVVGDRGAGPRTRAGEAYQLGILSGRIVRPQVARASFPSGWQAVIDGRVPSTKLGFYSYVIGKGLRNRPTDPNLLRALDCLASVLILHIGFQSNERWFVTALVFQFVYGQLERNLNRSLSEPEFRYLSAAVINTLDSDDRKILLEPYMANRAVDQLRFSLSDGRVVHFKLNDLPTFPNERKIGINDFEKTKAALFWSNPSRGIFTRASRSRGSHLIKEFIKVDQQLAQTGRNNLLEETLSAIQNNEESSGIFLNAEKTFADFPTLLREWQDLESDLFDATNKAVEAVELKTAPPIWVISQHQIREKEGVDTSEHDATTEEDGPIAALNLPDAKKLDKRKPKKQMELPSQQFIRDFVDRDLDLISEEPPTSNIEKDSTRETRTPHVTKVDFSEKEARNRKLGEAGEFFVYQYEIQKLNRNGINDLAKRVAWVSKELGDGLGYDIRSFDLDGRELFLEVKTTTSGRATPFFVSNNEVAVSEQKGTAFRLVRVFDFLKNPRFFTLSGSLSDTLSLEPTSYRARV